jgi:hypothetical protein
MANWLNRVMLLETSVVVSSLIHGCQKSKPPKFKQNIGQKEQAKSRDIRELDNQYV